MTVAMECDDCSSAIIDLPENKGLTLDELDDKYMLEDCRCTKKMLCNNCGKPATHETHTSGVNVCGDNECIVELATQEFVGEEISEDDHQSYGENYEKGKW